MAIYRLDTSFKSLPINDRTTPAHAIRISATRIPDAPRELRQEVRLWVSDFSDESSAMMEAKRIDAELRDKIEQFKKNITFLSNGSLSFPKGLSLRFERRFRTNKRGKRLPVYSFYFSIQRYFLNGERYPSGLPKCGAIRQNVSIRAYGYDYAYNLALDHFCEIWLSRTNFESSVDLKNYLLKMKPTKDEVLKHFENLLTPYKHEMSESQFDILLRELRYGSGKYQR